MISQLVKFLDSGFGPSSPASLEAILGSDAYLAKRQTAHKNQRKFMIEILLSLHSLHSGATSWERVLEVIEKYLQCLSHPRFNTRSVEFKSGYCLNHSLMVQVVLQVARKMFEAAFSVLLFLAYLVEVSGQVRNFFSRILKLFVTLIF
jgi:nuclear pore complex protein Nup160